MPHAAARYVHHRHVRRGLVVNIRFTADVVAKTVFVGTGQDGGADEDDFHTFKRKTQEVDKAEKVGEKARRKAEVKMAAHSGVVKAFGDSAPASKQKKVVFF